MTKVIFTYNLEDEINYLTELEKERQWFLDNDFPVELPDKGENFEILYTKHKTTVFKLQTKVETAWHRIEAKFWSILYDHIPNGRYHSKFNCHVSHFGPEGKYQRPNKIFVRLNNDKDTNIERILETIAHELVHVTMADYFEEQELSYKEKEKRVDDFITDNLRGIFQNYNNQSL